MRKIGVIFMLIVGCSQARAGESPTHSASLHQFLETAQFDRAKPVLDECKKERESAYVIACTALQAGIFRNEGNAPEWARSMISLHEEAAKASRQAFDIDLSEYYKSVDFNSLASLPPLLLTAPVGAQFIETLDGEGAVGSVWSTNAERLYLVEIRSGGQSSVAMVDTGAPAALNMSGCTADKLGITRVVGTVPAAARQLGAVVPPYHEELRFADEVSIGSIKLRNALVRVDPHDKSDRAVVGMGLLSRFESVGFSEGGITLGQSAPSESKVVPFRFSSTFDLGSSEILIDVRTHGSVYSAALDTGLSALVAFTNPLASMDAGESTGEFSPYDPGGIMPPFKMSRQTLSISDIKLTEVPTLLFWKSPEGQSFDVIIGGEIRKVLNLQINFSAGKIYFWPRRPR